MKNLSTAIALALVPLAAHAQPQPALPSDGAPQQNPIQIFAERVAEIAEKPQPQASDYKAMAQDTIALGQAALQSGQALPEPAIRDALAAVDAGEALNPLGDDWQRLRDELHKLLEPPPEQQQQDQQDQQNEQQDQQQQDESQNGSDSDSSQESQDKQSQQDSQGEPKDQQGDSDQEQQPQDSEQQQGEQQGQDQQGNQGEQGQEAPQEKPKTSDEGALGDLDEEQPAPQLDQPAPEPEAKPQPQPPTQTVGGAQKDSGQRGAERAVMLQKLDQLKQQDSPGELYQILLQDQQKDSPAPKGESKKDW